MLLAIRRAGKFRATKMIPNNHKCAAMRTRIYKYDVLIEADSRRLTKEGFLLNNELVQEFFEERFGRKVQKPWDAMSCERMAITSAQGFLQMLRKQFTVCHFIQVTIYGSNGAAITAKWGRE